MNKQHFPIVCTIMVFTVLSVFTFHAPTVNQEALKELLEKAKKTNSDALVILHDGKVLAEYYSTEKPVMLETMSITKSIVALAFGLLETQGLLKSVDQRVYEFYPEWKQGRKQDITVKQLLNHTSGLQDYSNAGIEIYPSPDFIKLALSAELSYTPGTHFFYSNKAVNLLPGIIQKATGKPIDTYLKVNLFNFLGIKESEWDHDEAGNPQGLAGLTLYPEDLAKIGQFVVQRGEWNKTQIICKSWFDIALQPAQPFSSVSGFLWWLLPESTTYVIDDQQIETLRASGINEMFLKKVALLKGSYKSNLEFDQKLESVLGKNFEEILMQELRSEITLSRHVHGPIIGYRAEGWLGQYLIIYPTKNLVGVRMIANNPNWKSENQFSDFAQLLYRVIN